MSSGAFRAATILCPGPSLAEAISTLQSLSSDAPFFGINRAVEAVECDYWIAIDHKTFDEVTPKGTPAIITTLETAKKIDRNVLRAYRSKPVPDHLPPVGTGWANFSTLLGITTAYDLGFNRIVLYGADMNGVNDWDGKQSSRVNRTETRWQKEHRQYSRLVTWMQSKGVEVTR